MITLSNLFTTPLATGIPFNWKDLTPVAMMALDEFVLWVNAETPYKTVKEYIEAIKAAPNGTFKMGGTGSKQEDQIITVAVEKATGIKFTYIPYRGGGEVAVQLVGNHVDSTSTIRSRRWRNGAAASCVRCACSTPCAAYHGQGAGEHGVGRYPDLQVAGAGHRVPDAARRVHAGRASPRSRSTTMSIC